MKKHFLAALLTTTSLAGWSQALLPAGTVQVGGGINYSQRHSENSAFGYAIEDASSFGVNPQAGYFIAPGWVLGLGLGYTADKSTYASVGSPLTSSRLGRSYYIGPYVQRYQMLTNQFGFTGTLSTSYLYGRYDYRSNNNNGPYSSRTTGHNLSATLTPGVVYLPVSWLALGASVGSLAYRYGRGSQQDFDGTTNDTKGSSFDASFGLSYLALSGTYFFRRN